MAVENTGGLVANFNPLWPTNTGLAGEGDNHMRLIKGTLQGQFPNVTGTVMASDVELNYLAGVTGNIQSQIDAIALPTGTRMLFVQAAPPVGWTLDASLNDRVIQINSASGGLTGGGWEITGLTLAPHSHTVDITTGLPIGTISTAGSSSNRDYPESDHTHEVTGSTDSTSTANVVSDGTWRMAYVNVVIGVKQ